jgi:redox-sensitive bicupin YhaK (pirin superfamily)
MQLLKSSPKNLGEFTVRRVLPSPERQLVGPFIFFDHMGPAQFQPGAGVSVRPHPHIGIATITYLFDGVIVHRDTLGYEQAITEGAVNWMTAGKGIAHSERTPQDLIASGSRLHGIQAWISLPLDQEQTEPSFAHYPRDVIPEKVSNNVAIRLIAGEAFGLHSPVLTASPTLYAELRMETMSNVAIAADYDELALYVVTGKIRLGDTAVMPGCMLTLDKGSDRLIEAEESSRVMLLGGASIEGERHLWWNFVSSSKEHIEAAKQKWRQGQFGTINGEDEFIPLPEK